MKTLSSAVIQPSPSTSPSPPLSSPPAQAQSPSHNFDTSNPTQMDEIIEPTPTTSTSPLLGASPVKSPTLPYLPSPSNSPANDYDTSNETETEELIEPSPTTSTSPPLGWKSPQDKSSMPPTPKNEPTHTLTSESNEPPVSSQDNQSHDPFIELQFLKYLKEVGFHLNKDLKLIKIDPNTGEVLSNQDLSHIKSYQAVAYSVCELVIRKLINDYNLTLLTLTNGTQILTSPNVKKESKNLLVLINGMPPATFGIWSREVCVKHSLIAGSVIPYVAEAQSLNMNVIIMNTNNSSVFPNARYTPPTDDTLLEAINFNHAIKVWDEVVRESPAEKIAIVAHSRGGAVLKDLIRERLEDFKENVVSIKLTDSAHLHEINEQTQMCYYLQNNAINYVTSTLPLGTRIDQFEDYIPRLSAGHLQHKMTSHSALPHIFEALTQKMVSIRG